MKVETGVPNNKKLDGTPIFWFTNKETVLQKCVSNKFYYIIIFNYIL